jgi:hypothetical protein
MIRRRPLGEEEAGVVRVEDDAVLGADARDVQVLRAEQAHLLADGEDGLDGRVRDVLLLQAADGLDDDGAAGLVVAAEHGRAVRADDVALDDRLDALARDDRVHVGGHHDRLGPGDGAGEARDDVARVAAHLLPGVVYLDVGAHLFAVLLDALGHVALVPRVAVNLYEFEQQILDALLVNHVASVAGDREGQAFVLSLRACRLSLLFRHPTTR